MQSKLLLIVPLVTALTVVLPSDDSIVPASGQKTWLSVEEMNLMCGCFSPDPLINFTADPDYWERCDDGHDYGCIAEAVPAEACAENPRRNSSGCWYRGHGGWLVANPNQADECGILPVGNWAWCDDPNDVCEPHMYDGMDNCPTVANPSQA